MLQNESSYLKLSKLLKKIKKDKEEVRLSTFIEQVSAELNLKVAAFYRVVKGNLVVEKCSGTVLKDTILFGYGPCGTAAEQEKTVLDGNRLAIPIMGPIILKQVFYAEGEFDEEDATQIEGLLKSFEDVNYKELLNPNPLKREELYKRMCTIIQFFYECYDDRWEALKKIPFQYFLQASCIACLARKSSRKGHTLTMDHEAFKKTVKTLFPGSNLALTSPNHRNVAFDTGKFTYSYGIDKYGIPNIFLPLLGTIYATVPIHSLLSVRELEDMAPTLREWFPENGSMGDYLNKQQRLRDILITTLENKARNALAPLGVEISVYLGYYIPDACKDNVCVNILYGPKKLIAINTSEENFDVFLQDFPQILEHVKSKETRGNTFFDCDFNNYPVHADLCSGFIGSNWFRIHVTAQNCKL